MSVIYGTTKRSIRQPRSVNSRLDFDAAQAAAALVYGRPAPSQRGGGGDVLTASECRPQTVDKGVENFDDLTTLKCDPELARIAVGLMLATLFRFWLILRNLNTETGRQGHTRAQFDAALRRHGVSGSKAYNARLLRNGDKKWWNIDPLTGMVYPYSYLSICKRLIELAAQKGLHDLFITNAPGSMRPMYISCVGTKADFESAILNAWYAAKNNPTISRMAICALFNRSEFTIRQLEARAGIQVNPNLVETIDNTAVPFKSDGELRNDVWRTKDEYRRTVYHFRLSNTYISTLCKQHCHKGQGRRAVFLLKLWIESGELPGMSAAGVNHPGKLNPLRLIYCKNENEAERSRKRGNDGMMFIPDRPGEGTTTVWTVYKH